MSKQSPTSQYFLTKEKKLEIHENNMIFRSKVPLRFYLNPVQFVQNIFFMILKSKKRLRKYTLIDLKDQQTKTIYLTHSEIQQVWRHFIEEKMQKAPKIKKQAPKAKVKKTKKLGA
jgi:hypothetical protein